MKLMFHFSFAKAAAVLTLFFSIALGWVSYRYYVVQTGLEKFYRQEELGIAKAEDIIKQLLTISTQTKISRDQLKENLEFIEKTRIELAEPNTGASDEDANSLTTEDRYAQIMTLKRYLRLVLDRSNLILDPSFQTYYLVDSMFSALPDIFYGKMTWNEAYWNLGHGNDRLTYQEIGAHESSIRHYMESLAKALRTNSSFISDGAITDLEALRGVSASFQSATAKTLDQLRQGDYKAVPLDVFEKNLEALRDEALHTIHAGVKLFSDLNGKRIEKSHFESIVSLGVSLFLWLISIIFMGVIIRAVVQSEATMKSLIVRQKEALARAQKLAALGEVSSSIGHEIANPLMVIKGTTDLLEEHFGEIPEIKKYSTRIKKMIERIDAIIRSMKFFLSTQDEPSGRAVVNLNIVISEAQEQLKYRIASTRVNLQIDGLDRDPLLVWGNEEDLIQVFTNLMGNAIDAVKSSDNKNIKVGISKREKQICVYVHDSGVGVRPEYRDKIFEALFTTKSPDEGTGLGLSIAKKDS